MRSYQAIVTKFLCVTNFRGSRVKASAAAGSITLSWDHTLNIEENHAKAAEALANKFGWSGQWYIGGLPNDRGYCFVCSDNDTRAAFITAKQKAA